MGRASLAAHALDSLGPGYPGPRLLDRPPRRGSAPLVAAWHGLQRVSSGDRTCRVAAASVSSSSSAPWSALLSSSWPYGGGVGGGEASDRRPPRGVAANGAP